MSGAGLVELARRYVACSDELESLREQIKLAVVNGGGDDKPSAPFVEAGRPGRTGSRLQSQESQSQKMILAQEAEERIVELLRRTPGLKTGQIAERTASKTNTVVERLKRLRAKGQVTRGDGREDGWSAAAAPG